jgi:hypothetical protein
MSAIAFQKLKKANPKGNAAELWKQAIDEVGTNVIKEAWKNLVPNDTWQDFYVEHRDFLAAEDNFWSSFGGVGLSTDCRETQRGNRSRLHPCTEDDRVFAIWL